MSGKPSRPITTKDIAKAAGVNQSTVSRALRNDPSISPPVRESIATLATKLGYRPNPFVSAFTSQVRNYRRSPQGATLALLDCRRPGEPDYSTAYREGAEARARQLGFSTEVFRLTDVGFSLSRLNQILWTRAIHGLLILPLYQDIDLSEIEFNHLAAATVDPSLHRPRLHRAQPNYFQGMQLCLDVLHQRGYRRPAFCSIHDEILSIATEWLGGFAGWQSIQEPDAAPRVYVMTEWGYQAFHRWLRSAKPDVVISNDHFFHDWAAKAGIASATLGVSEDTPNLSGIKQPNELVGAAAVDMIVAQIHRNEYGLPEDIKTLLIECTWVEKSSAPCVVPKRSNRPRAKRPDARQVRSSAKSA